MKLSVIVATFAIGAIATFALTKGEGQKVSKDIFDKEVSLRGNDRNHDNGLGDREEERAHHDKMVKSMMKMFDRVAMSDIDTVMDMNLRGGLQGESQLEVRTVSDQDHEYVEVFSDGLDPKAINVKIEEGYVTLSGTIEKKVERKSNGGISTSSYVSSFQRSFNVPSGVDESKVTFETQKNKLIIKFKKVNL